MHHGNHSAVPLVAPARVAKAQHKVKGSPCKSIDENLVQVKSVDLDHGAHWVVFLPDV